VRETGPPETGVMTSDSRRHFDAAAATWDDNPVRRALTAAIADAIPRLVPLRPDLRMLEYGCGTAALSVMLAGTVGQIVAADASTGMIDQVCRKLAQCGLRTIVPTVLDLTRDPLPAERFDLVVTAMALHHVEDTDTILRRLAEVLAAGGHLVVADLVREDGTFHADMAVPHHGFDPDELAQLLARAGVEESRWQIVHRVARAGREYPVFILSSRKPAQ
jgi:ubiquinone/menaquinone biosynthesis C-methylase UbiE